MRANRHSKESERLAELRTFGILDSPRERDFDDIASLAAEICDVPIAVVNLLDADRQWFKAEVGLGIREMPLDNSICAHAILECDFVEIPDVAVDSRFSDNPLVHISPGLRFYAGALLNAAPGMPLGTLCVLDTKPRVLTDLQRRTLKVLANQVLAQLELRKKIHQLEEEREAHERAAKVIAEGENFLRIVTDRMPVRVGYIDPNYRYLFINGEYERQFNLRPGEAWGRTIAEIVGTEAFVSAKELIDIALGGTSLTQELTVPYQHGTRRVLTNFIPDVDANGVVRGTVMHALDVTDRYEAEQALEREREQLEHVLETAHVATWSWNAATNQTFASSRLQFFFDISEEDANGGPLENYLRAVHPDDLPKVAEAIQHSQASGLPYEIQYRVVGQDRQERWVLARGNSDGITGELSGVLVDVTEHVRDNRRIAESESLFRTIFENVPDAIIRTDLQGTITAWSPSATETLGWSSDEVIGWSVDFLIGGLANYRRELELASRRGQSVRSSEFIRKDGSKFWGSAKINALSTDGEVRGFLIVLRDETERHEHEMRIQQFNDELEAKVQQRTIELQEAVKESEAFNYSISHDLRAPLRAMNANAQILLEDLGPTLDAGSRKMLDSVARNATRLGRLIDELLRLSRLARVEVVRQPIDLSEKVASIVAELGTGHPIEIQPGMTANGDRFLLRTVLQNLIDNAIKFSPQGLPIQVGETDGVIWVRDQGIGFDMRFAPKLFLPFERLVSDAEFEGTGIGLANVERIVRRHGGKVWAEGEPGKGATFYFTLSGND